MKKEDIKQIIKEETGKVLREVAITKTPLYQSINGIIIGGSDTIRPREAHNITLDILDYIESEYGDSDTEFTM